MDMSTLRRIAAKATIVLAVVSLPAMLAFAAGSARAADCSGTAAPGLDWGECSKKNLMLQYSDLQGANLFSTDFAMTDLTSSNLASANLEKATLLRTWLNGSKAEKANFTKVEAYRSSFANISAAGATFYSAELQRADFTGADLTGVSFEKAELGRANFSKANLTGVKFSYANLSRAQLDEAVFDGPLGFDHAFLFLTRIEGLDLSAAKGLEQSQIDLACGDKSTKLPTGLTTPPDWPCDFE
nr:pentapeptide repeat-containing protein [Pararhizobium antarcticum]